MNDAERMMLSDAIETAIKAEKNVIVQRRIICVLSAVLAALSASCIFLLV